MTRDELKEFLNTNLFNSTEVPICYGDDEWWNFKLKNTNFIMSYDGFGSIMWWEPAQHNSNTVHDYVEVDFKEIMEKLPNEILDKLIFYLDLLI